MSIEEVLVAAHEGAHAAPHDLDDMLFLQISQRETFLMFLMFIVTAQTFECLQDEMYELHARMTECLKTQKEHWQEDDDEDEELVEV